MDLIGNNLQQMLPQSAEISCEEIVTTRRQYLQVLVGTFGLLRCQLPDASFHAPVPQVGLLWCGLDVASRTHAELVGPKTLGPVQRYSGARRSCPNIAYENCTSTVPRAKYVLSRDPDEQAG